MDDTSRLNVLVVDDHELVRVGMRRLLEDNALIQAISEAETGERALELIKQVRFDIVLMDINLPGISGYQTAVKMLEVDSRIRIIAVTGGTAPVSVQRLLGAGVLGYITKGSARELSAALQSVAVGERYLSADAAQQVAIELMSGTTGDPFELLTTREMEVINLLMSGLRNRQMSARLHISEKTVSTHRTRAFEKLGIRTPAELVRLAIRHHRWNED